MCGLYSASFIRIKILKEFINTIINLIGVLSRLCFLNGNESYTQFSYRAVAIAFRKNILLYIMCGMKWTKEIEDFIIWSFDYDLWCKMCLMGTEIKQKLERDYRIMKPGVPCMLEQLGDTFTREEYNVLERVECPDAKQRGNLLSQWKRRGWVELNEELKVYVKTQNYYQKHSA